MTRHRAFQQVGSRFVRFVTTRLSCFALFFGVAFGALPASATWWLASGTAGTYTSMTNAAGNKLYVTVLSATDRTLILGRSSTTIYNDGNSNANALGTSKSTGEAVSFCVDLSQDIFFSDPSNKWTIVEVGQRAFYNNKKVTNPDDGLDLTTVTNIRAGAFGYATALTKIRLSAKLEEVGASAFNCAYGITSFVPQFPTSLKRIGAGAFAHHATWDAGNLMKIAGDIELRGVETIQGSAFYWLPGVKSYTFGPNLTSISQGGIQVDSMEIRKGPLEANTNLTTITWLGSAPTITNNLWYGSGVGNAITNYVYSDHTNSWNSQPAYLARTAWTNAGPTVYQKWVLSGAPSQTGYAALLPGHPPSATQPVFVVNPSLVRTETGFSLSASLSQGNGLLLAVFAATDGSAVTNAITEAEVAGNEEAWYSVAATGLAANRTYAFGVLATNVQAETSFRAGVGTFFTGEVSVAPPGAAFSENGGTGSFTFSRPGTDGDLAVAFASTGSAAEFANFREIAKTVTIPNGQSSATVTLTGVVDLLTTTRMAALSIAPGLYAISAEAGSASVALTDYVAPVPTDFDNHLTYTAAGYAGASVLTRFPVLVRIPKGRVTDFTRIAFFDAQGEYLPFDVDTVNSGGESLVWVGVPSLDATATVTLAWNPMVDYAIPESLKFEVWRDANYVAVWHLGENAASIQGSTVYGINGTRSGGVTNCVVGAAGAAQTIATANSTSAFVAFPEFNRYYANLSEFTFSAWIYHADRETANNEMIVSSKMDNAGSLGFQIMTYNAMTNCDNFAVFGNSSFNQTLPTYANRASFGARTNWLHLAAAYLPTGNSAPLYVGGVINRSVSVDPVILSIYDLTLGNASSKNKNCFVGSIDEVRIRNGTSSADWVKAESDAVRNPKFLTFPKPGVILMVY